MLSTAMECERCSGNPTTLSVGKEKEVKTMRDRPRHVVCLGLCLIVLVLAVSSCSVAEAGQNMTGVIMESTPASAASLFSRVEQDSVLVKEEGVLPDNINGAFVTLSADPRFPCGSADDFSAIWTVARDAALLHDGGSGLNEIKVDLVDGEGKSLWMMQVPLTVGNWVTTKDWAAPRALADSDVAADVTFAVAAALSDSPVTADEIRVATDWSGARTILINATTRDPSQSWLPIAVLRAKVADEVAALNRDRQALVALAQIHVNTVDGRAVHRSWLDCQFRIDSAWYDQSIPEIKNGEAPAPVPVGIEDAAN